MRNNKHLLALNSFNFTTVQGGELLAQLREAR